MMRSGISGSRPSSAKANAQKNRPASAHVARTPLRPQTPSWFGQVVQHREHDASDDFPRSRFGAWQGKKFALPADYYYQQQQQQQDQMMESLTPSNGGFGGVSGIGGLSVVRKTVGGRQATFLERGTRRAMLDKIRVSNVQQADKASATGGTAGQFMPRLRPKSAGARSSTDYGPGSPRALLHQSPRDVPRDNVWGGSTEGISPYGPTESRVPGYTRPASAGAQRTVQLLSDLNLPSLPESEVDHTLFVEPVSDALSVDGEVALLRLSRAGDGAVFCDDSFPASDVSVGNSPELLQAVHTWARPHEICTDVEPILLPTNAAPSDVEQGALGDCYFLGALSVVANRSDILSQLFGHFKMIDSTVTFASLMEKGLFTVQLYKDCDWHDVTVDTRIPCKMEGGRLVPCFGRCTSPSQMWAPILEKAYAKLHGSYQAIAGGRLSEAMADLTGGVTETVDISSPEALSRVQSGELWRTLQECKLHGHLLSCSLSIKGATPEAIGPNGLLVNHAYAILDVQTIPEGGVRLVKVRNPWGRDSWDGDWSPHSALWSIHPHAAKFLHYIPDQAGNGTFWMSYEDLVSKFNRVYLCRIFPLHWHNLAIRSEWSQQAAGGPVSDITWFLNPQFRVSVPQTTAAVITVAQLDRRLPGRDSSQLAPAHVGLTVLKVKRRTYPPRIWDPEDAIVVGGHAPSAARDVSVTLRFHPDTLYYIVPNTSKAKQTAPFLLRIYSSALVELQRTVPCHGSSVRGSWVREYAGGRKGNPSWTNNPQYCMRSAADTDVLLLLRTTDDASNRAQDRKSVV